MKHMVFIIFPLALFFLLQSDKAYAKGDYVKVQEKNNITIYKKKSDATRNLKVVFEVPSNKTAVKNLLLSPSTYQQWFDQVLDIKTIDRVNDTLKYVWVLIGVRKIFTRQGVLKTTTHYGTQTETVHIGQELDKDHPYREKDYDEIRGFDTRWNLDGAAPGRVQIELIVQSAKEDRSNFINNMLDRLLTRELHKLALKIRRHF